MKRGKDRHKRAMNPASLANLQPFEQARPAECERLKVDVFLRQHDAKAWRRLTPAERGELISQVLEMRSGGQ